MHDISRQTVRSLHQPQPLSADQPCSPKREESFPVMDRLEVGVSPPTSSNVRPSRRACGEARIPRLQSLSVRILVTGGAGFIGSNLVDALLARGHEVAVLDDLSTGRLENLDGALAVGATLHEGSVADPDLVARLLAEARPEAILHLAAQIDVRRAVEDPAFDAQINVVGTTILLEAARLAGVGRLVLACTGGAIYGDTEDIPTPEAAPRRPMSPYGTSKAAAEDYFALYERLHGMSTLSLRLANVYGPRQDPRGRPV